LYDDINELVDAKLKQVNAIGEPVDVIEFGDDRLPVIALGAPAQYARGCYSQSDIL
jgi:hypothetical protein